MSADELVIAVVREWVERAEEDLLNATHSLKLRERCPSGTVCFHAQQCVEKYIKACLTLCGVPFPRTHNIEALVQLIPPHMAVHLSVEEQRQLTIYAILPRFDPPATLAQAREAVKIARRVRKEIRRLLPRKALRRQTT